MPLGSWNDVPGKPDYYYGLAVRSESGLTVEIYRKQVFAGARIGTVTAPGWSDDFVPGSGDGVHTKARKLIEKRESHEDLP